MSIVFVLLAGLLLVAHVYTIIRTGKEKRETCPEKQFSDASRTLIGILGVLDGIGIGFFVLIFFLFELRWYLKLCYVLEIKIFLIYQ